jgi:hypothetical protein
LSFCGPRERIKKFEDFITHLAAGARWKVLSGATLIAATGLALLFLPRPASSSATAGCLIAKTVLFAIAVGLFCLNPVPS